MAIKLLDTEETVRYVSRYDPAGPSEDDGATVFTLGALDGRAEGTLADMRVRTFVLDDGSVETKMNTNRVAYLRVQLGLRGVENLNDPKEGPVKTGSENVQLGGVTYTAMPSRVVNRLPREVIQELSGKIAEIGGYSEEDLGNFDSPPTDEPSTPSGTAPAAE